MAAADRVEGALAVEAEPGPKPRGHDGAVAAAAGEAVSPVFVRPGVRVAGDVGVVASVIDCCRHWPENGHVAPLICVYASTFCAPQGNWARAS